MAMTIDRTTELPRHALIGGRWVEGSAGTFEVRSPHSGELVNEMTRCSAADVDLAVAAASAAQPAWAATPLIERVKVLRRINALFVERAEPIARVLVQEIGKTITESREEVYEYAAPSWQKAGEEVLRHRGLSFPSTQEQTNNKRLVLTHRPLGRGRRDHARTTSRPTSPRSRSPTSSPPATRPCGSRRSTPRPSAPWSPTSSPRPGCPPAWSTSSRVSATSAPRSSSTTTSTGSSSPARRRRGSRSPLQAGLKPRLLELGGDGPFIILPRRRHRRGGRRRDDRLLLLRRPGVHVRRAAAGARGRPRRVRRPSSRLAQRRCGSAIPRTRRPTWVRSATTRRSTRGRARRGRPRARCRDRAVRPAGRALLPGDGADRRHAGRC